MPLSAAPASARVVVEHPRIDLRRTLEPLVHGRGDPTIRFAADGIWRATRTPSGPATLRLVRLSEERVAVEAWGTGAEVALGEVPALIGLTDDPAALVTHDRAIAMLATASPVSACHAAAASSRRCCLPSSSRR